MSEIVLALFAFATLFVGCGIAGSVMGMLEKNEERIIYFIVRSTFLLLKGFYLALLGMPSMFKNKSPELRTIYMTQAQLESKYQSIELAKPVTLSHQLS